jgi:hypothetical protein
MKRLGVHQLDPSGATDGDGLVWDDTANQWAPAAPAAAGIPATLLDAKGDLIVASASDTAARLAVGSNGQVLTADSAEATGTKWATPSTGFADPLTTKGDLITRTASATGRKAVGSDGQVLVADSSQTDGVAWSYPNSSVQATNFQTGTSYTLVLSDLGKFVSMLNAAASTLTVPPNSSVAFPVGTIIQGAQRGAGQVTLTPGSGVTIEATPGLKVAAQYGSFALRKLATDTWIAVGRLAA